MAEGSLFGLRIMQSTVVPDDAVWLVGKDEEQSRIEKKPVLVLKAKIINLVEKKDCPKSPTGIHKIGHSPTDPDVTEADQFCIYCGEAIW